jgi:hypothetical protein
MILDPDVASPLRGLMLWVVGGSSGVLRCHGGRRVVVVLVVGMVDVLEEEGSGQSDTRIRSWRQPT